jgi:hypothetical protein
MKYSHAKTAELITRRVHWKPGNPPSAADALVNDVCAQLAVADEKITRQKAHFVEIARIHRENEDE